MGENDQRIMPTSELDAQMMMTNSVWGRNDVPEELKNRLAKHFSVRDEKGEQLYDQKGNPLVTTDSLWGILGHYTRDMRLANLDSFGNELALCRYMIDLSTDYLTENMVEPFITSLSRAVTILETSQSKGGFLRKQMNTLTHKNLNQTLEPPKKGFLGKGGSQTQ